MDAEMQLPMFTCVCPACGVWAPAKTREILEIVLLHPVCTAVSTQQFALHAEKWRSHA